MRLTASGRAPALLLGVLMLLAAQFLVLLGSAPRALAAPGDRPVTIVIDSIAPQVATPGDSIVITGSLVNTGETAITDLTMRLQRGPALESRSDLADNDATPVDAADSSTAFVDIDLALKGSGVLRFTYQSTSDELGLTETGAYPILVNLNGREGAAAPSRVGEVVTLLPYLEQAPTGVTQLSWLWPLVGTPERNAAGQFTGHELATSVSNGGRLEQALSAIETSPGLAGATPQPQAVTLAVDPALLEEVGVLAAGNYPILVGGQQQTSSVGSVEAASWLDRLRTLALTLPVVSLPYADPDLSTLLARGQGRAVENLLPDGPSGDLVEDILGVEPIDSIGWPHDGAAADPAVLDLLVSHEITQVVTDEASTFERRQGTTLNAVTQIDAPSGSMTALVGDDVLRGLLQTDIAEPGARSATEQRFLAELVAIAAEAPGLTRHLLIAPERDFQPNTASAVLQATAGLSWLGRQPATELSTLVGNPTPRTTIPPAQLSTSIPAVQLVPLIDAMRARDGFASAMTDPDTDLLALDRALARAATSNRSPNQALGVAAVSDVSAAVGRLGATVGIIAPVNGTYSLASADAPLVLTVFNDNAFAVAVRIALAPRGAPGVTTTNVEQTLPAGTRTIVQIPADVERSGSFTVIASLTTPADSPLGVPIQLRVQSTVYGPVALAITFGAGAVLFLLFARRSLRYWRLRRRGGGPDGSGGPSGSAADSPVLNENSSSPPWWKPADDELMQPPQRSPV